MTIEAHKKNVVISDLEDKSPIIISLRQTNIVIVEYSKPMGVSIEVANKKPSNKNFKIKKMYAFDSTTIDLYLSVF